MRLALTGGMPEVFGRASGQGQQLLRASERGVCWVAYDYADLQILLRCLPFAEPPVSERAIDSTPSLSLDYALAPDAVYWLRSPADGAPYELLATAL